MDLIANPRLQHIAVHYTVHKFIIPSVQFNIHLYNKLSTFLSPQDVVFQIIITHKDSPFS